MSERELDHNDRNLAVNDQKRRIFDTSLWNYVPPDIGIYDEPVRYFKANEQWCKIIFGHLGILETVAGWKDAEDETHVGIQAILTFEAGIMPVVDEGLKQTICEAIECGFTKIAARIVSGSTSGFEIDEDGNLVPDSGDTPIEDDPETEIDESNASFDGGCREVAQNIDGLFERIQALYLAASTEANTFFIISNEYDCDPILMEAAISEFYTRKLAPLPTIVSINQYDLSEYMYCHNETIKKIITGYILSAFPTNDGTAQHGCNIVNGLTDAQISSWHAKGVRVLSTQYITYGCVPVQSEVIEFRQADGDFAGAAYKIGSVVNKIGHRMLIDVQGKVIDTVVGGYQDFYWRVAADGTKTFIGISGSLGTHQVNSCWTQPTAEEVPFRSDGHYTLTRDTYEGGEFLSIRRKMTNPSPGGIFTMNISDLGEA